MVVFSLVSLKPTAKEGPTKKGPASPQKGQRILSCPTILWMDGIQVVETMLETSFLLAFIGESN